jgi:hypothetical protein
MVVAYRADACEAVRFRPVQDPLRSADARKKIPRSKKVSGWTKTGVGDKLRELR